MGESFQIIPPGNVGMVLTRLVSEGVGSHSSLDDELGIWVESGDMRESVPFPNKSIADKYYEAESQGRLLHLSVEKENKVGWKLRFPREIWQRVLSLSEGNFDLVESKEGYHLFASFGDIPHDNLGVIRGEDVGERLKVMSTEVNNLIPSSERGVGSPGLIFINEIFFAGVSKMITANDPQKTRRLRMIEVPADIPDDEIKNQLKDIAVDSPEGVNDDTIHIIHVPSTFMGNDVFRLNSSGDGNATTRKLVVYRVKSPSELMDSVLP